jgi:hypothetical protein
MTDRLFTIYGILPIPVGNQVELQVFELHTSVFGTKLTPMEHQPLVRDLVTGILYGQQWHFTNADSANATDVPLEPRKDLQRVELIRGRVAATRTFTGKLPEMGSVGLLTTLLVSVDDPV